MPIGRLTRWDGERGYGFLKADDAARGSAPAFVHISQMKRIGIASPRVDDVFAYRIQGSGRGAEAVDLELIARSNQAA